MRIIFIGAVEFSCAALQRLIELRANIVGVCSLTESKFNSDHRDLTPIARNAGIPVYSVLNINDSACVEWIRSLNPDVIFCFGWSRLIGGELLNMPRLGIVGFHPASLPANRGRHPLIWALALGLPQIASTFFIMDHGADSGDIISQTDIPISSNDDASTLYVRMTDIALRQLEDLLPALSSGTFIRLKQDESLANTWRKRNASDGRIDWRMSSKSIHNLVRALTKPYVGAHFDLNGGIVKVWKTSLEVPSTEINIEPGKVLVADESEILVKTGDGAIKLINCEPRVMLIKGSYL
jgi:methionyl-tRNA formyltransferase